MIFKRKSSMRINLILMFVCTTLITHVVMSAVAQRTIESYYFDLGVRFVNNKFKAMEKDVEAVARAPKVIDSYDSHYRSPSKIWRIDNKVVTYQNSKTQLPVDKATFFVEGMGENISQRWDDNGDHYLSTSFGLSDETTLVIGLNINHHMEFFDAVSRMMVWFTLIASVLAGIYSVIIVNSGLKPLKRFEEYLVQIKPGHLDIRIPTEKLPIELETLGLVQNSMLDRLDLGFQRLSDFSADIAHELRTPLTNMNTQTQVMLSHDREAEEYRDILGSNLEELERITKTINDTLYLAQAENQLLYQNKEVLDLEKELSQLVEYHSIMAEDEDIEIVLKGQGGLYVDKNMFQRAINNLLSNAIRHSTSGSTINVDIKHVDEIVNIAISNEGDSISEEVLPFIFERFYRGDCSRNIDCGAGSGLGLAITKSIVETYDGNISVESVNGKTKFEMSFPSVCKI